MQASAIATQSPGSVGTDNVLIRQPRVTAVQTALRMGSTPVAILVTKIVDVHRFVGQQPLAS